MKYITAGNQHNLAAFKFFDVDRVTIGHVRPALAAEMTKYPEIFVVSERNLTFTGTLIGFEKRSAAMARVLADLVKSGLLPPERGEFYPVAAAFSEEPFFQLDRGAISAFGIRASGVHVNGFTRNDKGAIEMWIARRAKDRVAYPNMLDNMVAGGQPYGLGLKENMVKECGEEAGIPPEIAQRVQPVGMILYDHQSDDGAKPDRQYCFDLELPADFEPVAADGEVDEFTLWPIEQVAAKVRDTFAFKFNCNLVIIDFLIRHGILDPDSEPDYTDLCRGLYKGDAL